VSFRLFLFFFHVLSNQQLVAFSQVAHISLARSIFERRDLNKSGVITLKIDELMQISAVL